MEKLRLLAPLSFEGNVAENFRKSKQSFEIYLAAIVKAKKHDELKVLLLNIMDEEALELFRSH